MATVKLRPTQLQRSRSKTQAHSRREINLRFAYNLKLNPNILRRDDRQRESGPLQCSRTRYGKWRPPSTNRQSVWSYGALRSSKACCPAKCIVWCTCAQHCTTQMNPFRRPVAWKCGLCQWERNPRPTYGGSPVPGSAPVVVGCTATGAAVSAWPSG